MINFSMIQTHVISFQLICLISLYEFINPVLKIVTLKFGACLKFGA